MHTRLTALAGRGRMDTARRRLLHDALFPRNSRGLQGVLPGSRSYVSLVGNRRRLRRLRAPEPLHRQDNTYRSSLHTTSQSLAPPATVLKEEDDKLDDDLEKEIEMLTNSSVSQFLPKEIFYTHDEKTTEGVANGSYTLDRELGIDSVWESQSQEEADEDSAEQVSTASATTRVDESKEHNSRQRTPMEILRNFDPKNPPPSIDKEDLQLWLECAAQQEAVRRYQKLVEKARDRKAFDSMGILQRQIVRWYQDVRDSIDSRQKEYLSNRDLQRGQKRYGPFLCSLLPDNMAVTVAHEAILQSLLYSGKDGKEGIPLVKMAAALGAAVETEVVSQRRIKERFHDVKTVDESDEDEKEFEDNSLSRDGESKTAIDRWTFSASHLKLYMDELQRIDPKLGKSKRAIKYAIRRAKQAMNSEENWTKVDRIHLGAALMSILIESARLKENGEERPAFRLEKKWIGRNKSANYVILDDSMRKLFLEDNYQSFAPFTTRYTPMIVPPTDWVGPNQGGYRWLKSDLMRTHESNFQQEALQHADLSLVCDGLNILGKTGWKINKDVLKIALHCHENNIAIGDIPTRTDHELPPEPVPPERIDPKIYNDTESPEAKAAVAANKEYRQKLYKRRRLLQKNMDLNSLRCSAMLKLNQADKFKDFERIYFPYNLDFRGRAYPIPPHLSNVGSDLCRGMLKFADAKPLGKKGLYWLKVHLANFAGKDKMSFDDRAKYVEENMNNVRASVENPFSSDPWWMALDDPFQGWATCHEIIRAIDSGDPENYKCSLPVHMDGSCNGLQHYAALGRDTIGGKAVNLLEADGPEDVYLGVMHEVIRRVAAEAETDLNFNVAKQETLTSKEKKALKNNQAAKLVNGLIDRGVVKRTVMTSVYGVTYIGARTQIQEKLEEKLEEQGFDIEEMDREIFTAAGYLATITMEVMGDLFQGARNTKTWLADCARLISKQGHPVAWISPIGVPAIQPYRRKKPRTVVTVMQSVTMVDESDDLPVHTARQVTAFPPNYVHSLDSSHMLSTAIEMDRRGLAFSAVHDSFWTHACDVDEMNEALRDCFIDLYSQPLLRDLKKSWEVRYPEVEFPELPELGDLNLNEVKAAKYFFQ